MKELYEESEAFLCHSLDGQHRIYVGRLPGDLMPGEEQREALWGLHPEEYHRITMVGREVETPRWQQAYGADYHYTGRINRALPVPAVVAPFLAWARESIYPVLNGVVVNWYDGQLGHHIGPHRDSIVNMVEGAPIVTISLGEDRLFRLRPWRGKGYQDFLASDGAVFVLPYRTNLAWTHEVPHRSRYLGRRISITLRAFGPASSPPGGRDEG